MLNKVKAFFKAWFKQPETIETLLVALNEEVGKAEKRLNESKVLLSSAEFTIRQRQKMAASLKEEIESLKNTIREIKEDDNNIHILTKKLLDRKKELEQLEAHIVELNHSDQKDAVLKQERTLSELRSKKQRVVNHINEIKISKNALPMEEVGDILSDINTILAEEKGDVVAATPDTKYSDAQRKAEIEQEIKNLRAEPTNPPDPANSPQTSKNPINPAAEAEPQSFAEPSFDSDSGSSSDE